MNFYELEGRTGFRKSELFLQIAYNKTLKEKKYDFCVVNEEKNKAFIIESCKYIDIYSSDIGVDGLSNFEGKKTYLYPFYASQVPECLVGNSTFENLYAGVHPLVLKKDLLLIQKKLNVNYYAKKAMKETNSIDKSVSVKKPDNGAER